LTSSQRDGAHVTRPLGIRSRAPVLHASAPENSTERVDIVLTDRASGTVVGKHVAAFEAALDALAGDLGVEPALLRAALSAPERDDQLPEPNSADRAAMLKHFQFLLGR
jgi:hypothetical protein